MHLKSLTFVVFLTVWNTLLFGQTTLVLSPASIPNGQYGSVYTNQQLTATGGTAPYTFAVITGTLPTGLSLSAGGIISGTPTAAGSYSFTIKATDASPTPGPYTGSRAYTIVVNPATLTIIAGNGSKAYGSPNPAFSVNYVGFVNGDNSTAVKTAPTVSSTATAASPAGTYPTTASGASAPNYSITYQPGTLTVTKAPLTATADNKSMPLGGPLPAFSVTYTGFVNGDNAASLTAPSSATSTAMASSPAGNYPITVSGGASTNYTFTYTNGTLTVATGTLTITANPASSIYGAPLLTGSSLTVNYSGFVNGDGPANMTTLPTISNTAVAGSPAGTYTLTPSGAVNPNYTIKYATGTYTINPAPLTITPVNQTIVYGGSLPAFTATYTGFVNGETAANLSKPPTLSTTANSASPAGVYPITAAGAVDANYSITYQPGTLTVNKAPLTLTADNKSMPLGGPVPPLTISYTGFVNGDNATKLTAPPTISTTALASSPAGSYPITVTGGASPNYTLSYVNGTLSVATAVLTITANPAGSTYGSPLVPGSSLTVSYSGFVNGDGPSSLTTLPTVANTAVPGAPAGSYTLTPSGAASPNYTIRYVTGIYTISPAPLTITPVSQTITYGGAIPAFTASYAGFVNGESAANLSKAPTISTTATAASPAGAYPITASGAVDANYAITYQPGTLAVNKAALTIRADNKAMPLGGPLPPLTVSYTGFVNGDNATSLTAPLSVTTTALASSPAGTYPIIVTGGASPNYTLSYVNGTLSVATAVLTITAGPAGSTYGAPLLPNSSIPISYSGFVNGDGPNSLTVKPTVTNSATPGARAGAYTLTPSGAVSSNYTIQYITGVYTISPASLTITPANQTMTYGGALPAFTATYTGFVNGDNVSSLTTAPVLSTTATTGSPAGAYPIKASGAVDANYSITYQPGTLTVNKAPLTITADNKAMALGGPLPQLTATYSGLVNGDNAASLSTPPSITTTAVATSPAGTYPITIGGAASPNYTISYLNGTLAVAKAVLTITASPAGSVYGSPLVPGSSLPVAYTGFVNGDGPSSMTVAPTVTNTATPSSPAGAYTLIPSGAVNPNYAIQYNKGVYTIRPAVLNVTPAGQTMTYGGPLPPLSVTYSGFVNGDNASSLTTAPIVTTTASSSSPAGTYPITASGAVDPNYNMVYNPGTLTINPATIHVTAKPQTKEYGVPDPVLVYTVTGLLNGDNMSVFTGSLNRSPGENVGTYPISIGSLSAGGNYTINFTGSNLTIVKGSQHITWNQSLLVGCDTLTQVLLNATASSGLPVAYSVSDPSIASVSGNELSLLHPGVAVVTALQPGDANHNAAAPATDTVHYQSASLVRQHWNDAIFFDNSSGNYVQWQWFKNGDPVPGATSPYYSETPSLNGKYFVIATNKSGQQLQTCVLSINGSSSPPGGIRVQPNPVAAGGTITVISNYSSAALLGAVLQVMDLNGRVRTQVTAVLPSIQVAMPSDTGIYIINLLLANGQKASANVLVVY